MGSGSSILPLGAMSGYAMTKEAVRVLARVGAVEWGRFGIRVNSICPMAETPGLAEFGERCLFERQSDFLSDHLTRHDTTTSQLVFGTAQHRSISTPTP
jgi:NAD(P)-dependent dehydrogenase (short-subunit alcohol dehydrogenase family)